MERERRAYDWRHCAMRFERELGAADCSVVRSSWEGMF